MTQPTGPASTAIGKRAQADHAPSPQATTARRGFLKTAVATGAAASLLQRSVHAQGDETIRVGLIGCGGRGSGAAVNVMTADKYAKIVALADMFEDRLTQCRQQLSRKHEDQFTVDDEHCYLGIDAYQKLIDNADVDVVCLCSPPHFRAMQLEAAIKAGKHVFCEKPVAVDPTGVRKVLELSKLAKEKKLNLVSGLCWRYDRGVKATIEQIKNGAIGDIVATQEDYLTGTLWQRTRQPGWSDMEYQMRNWLYYRWLSGDHIVEQFIHSLDKSLWLHDDKPPVSAYGLGGRQVRTGEEFGDIYDHFSIVYEWADGTRTFAHTRQMSDCFNQVEDFVYGTKGTAKILSNEILGESGRWKYDGEKPSMYDEEHRALFSAIRDGNVINNGEYMCYSTLMAIMGREACYSGKTIKWDELMNSPMDLSPHTYEFGAAPSVSVPMPGKYVVS
jgi:myo-inositol 2-dehydrogenase / D-chiro-inositol 1-dehydrogenase